MSRIGKLASVAEAKYYEEGDKFGVVYVSSVWLRSLKAKIDSLCKTHTNYIYKTPCSKLWSIFSLLTSLSDSLVGVGGCVVIQSRRNVGGDWLYYYDPRLRRVINYWKCRRLWVSLSLQTITRNSSRPENTGLYVVFVVIQPLISRQ